MATLILVINPGSTSTKVALFDGETMLNEQNLDHPLEEMKQYATVMDQFEMRKKAVLDYMAKNNVTPEQLTAIASRGGGFGVIHTGAYEVDADLYKACQTTQLHAAMLGTVISYELIKQYPHLKAFIYDATTSDEMEDYARFTGIKGINRKCSGHILNGKAMGRKYAEKIGKKYEDCTVIVSHLGGGCTTSLQQNGRVVDIVTTDEGAFTPERCGGMPVRALINLCFSGEYTQAELTKVLFSKMGLISHLGTSDAREVEKMIENGDAYAKSVYYAMAYRLSKDIGALAGTTCGKLDGIVITGGMAHSKMLTGWIKEMTGFLAPVEIIPGAMEMEALALGALRVLQGKETARKISEDRNLPVTTY